MKTRNILLLASIVALAIGHSLEAQNTTSGMRQTDIKLSGSDKKPEEVVANADTIFVGEIAEIGMGDTKATDRCAYYGVKVKVLQVLKGKPDSQVVVTLYTTFGGGIQEYAPKVGISYIFFAHKNTEVGWDAYTVIKLLPATDDHVTKVKGLITTGSAQSRP